ncbi:MarR family transcriptional regulator [Parageobacillus toebii]|uniref:MarR family transcriptional regulator n=1 Tax=Parageobacillus toebii TaxID=153151 RepID=UPI00196833D6|nr:helix-turn-helix domain-containing protein [Parageobacillus toebii]QSB50610.1 MarR family transcriptional regulator [Parageobacillus toebii]
MFEALDFQSLLSDVESFIKSEPLFEPWGNRDHLTKLGKPMNEIQWHSEPKLISSPFEQIELYFNWLQQVNDRRTRRIVAAYPTEYWVSLSQKDYDQLKDKEKYETIVEKAKALVFEEEKLPKEPTGFEFELIFSDDDPVKAYKKWIEDGSEKEREFALKYGTIYEETIYKVKKPTMAHDFYTFSRAKKYLNQDYKNKMNGYHNTSIVYVIPSKREYRRRSARVTELCVLFSELDYYKLDEYKNKTHDEMIELIYEELDKHHFPRPTEVIRTRGLHLVWKISPIPAYRVLEWEMLQKKIHSILGKFGSDSHTVTDKVRLLRLCGTIHKKTNQKIIGYSYTDDRYLFDELIEKFCKEEVEREKERRKNARKQYAKEKKKRLQLIQGNRTVKAERKTTYTEAQDISSLIYEKYLHDLFVLVDLRDGKLYGHREFLCFLTRYFTLIVTKGNHIKAIDEMKKMFDSLDIHGDYTWEEILTYTKSAETAYERFKKYRPDGYNYKNSTLVEKLKITKEEQKHMKILIDDQEKKERKSKRNARYYEEKQGEIKEKNKKRYHKKRQEQGKLSREEQKRLKIEKIKAFLAANPGATIREIAEKTGIPRSTVSRIMKENGTI